MVRWELREGLYSGSSNDNCVRDVRADTSHPHSAHLILIPRDPPTGVDSQHGLCVEKERTTGPRNYHAFSGCQCCIHDMTEAARSICCAGQGVLPTLWMLLKWQKRDSHPRSHKRETHIEDKVQRVFRTMCPRQVKTLLHFSFGFPLWLQEDYSWLFQSTHVG